jgi:hypothetical protein
MFLAECLMFLAECLMFLAECLMFLEECLMFLEEKGTFLIGSTFKNHLRHKVGEGLDMSVWAGIPISRIAV